MSTPNLHSALSAEEWSELETKLFDGAGVALIQLRDYARSRHLPPVAFVITACLRVLSSLPGSVTFDAGVGRGSLNLFVALVGKPGQGKDRLIAGTNEAVTVAGAGSLLAPEELALGSGEGIAEALNPSEGETTSAPVLFGASEIGEVAALMGRTGSTLRGNLLKMYSGNALGFTNRGEKFVVPAHSYTAGLWVGVQPDKAGALLDGEDDGLRHRFIWTELVDPTRREDVYAADELKAVDVPLEILAGAPIGFHGDIVRDTTAMMDVTLRYGVQGSNSGHRHQTKLKLAAGLALLRSSGTVDLDDWRRAEALMSFSERVQDRCLRHLQGQRDQKIAERQNQQDRAEEQAQEQRMVLCRDKLLKKLESGETVTRSEVLQSVHSRQRPAMQAVLEALEVEEMIEIVEGANNRAYLRRHPSFSGVWE